MIDLRLMFTKSAKTIGKHPKLSFIKVQYVGTADKFCETYISKMNSSSSIETTLFFFPTYLLLILFLIILEQY